MADQAQKDQFLAALSELGGSAGNRKLRGNIVAAGEKLKLTVKRPRRSALRIHHLGDVDIVTAKPVLRSRGLKQMDGGRGR